MLSKSHAGLRRQAHFQIEAMCSALLTAAQDQDCETLPYLVQSLAIRIYGLNSLMTNADEDADTQSIKDLRFEVRGGALGCLRPTSEEVQHVG